MSVKMQLQLQCIHGMYTDDPFTANVSTCVKCVNSQQPTVHIPSGYFEWVEINRRAKYDLWTRFWCLYHIILDSTDEPSEIILLKPFWFGWMQQRKNTIQKDWRNTNFIISALEWWCLVFHPWMSVCVCVSVAWFFVWIWVGAHWSAFLRMIYTGPIQIHHHREHSTKNHVQILIRMNERSMLVYIVQAVFEQMGFCAVYLLVQHFPTKTHHSHRYTYMCITQKCRTYVCSTYIESVSFICLSQCLIRIPWLFYQ